jgi:predicted enzyme related to lactoylglutathione lyase
VEEKDMGPMGTYRILKRGEKQTCGIMKQPQAGMPSSWLHYIHVSDVDSTTRNAKEIGGQVFMQPMDIPKIGRFSVIADTSGGVVALFKGAM